MSTQDVSARPTTDAGRETARATSDATSGAAPSWWHRSHPVFTPLVAFFTGLVVVIVEFVAFGAVLSKLAGRDNVLHLLPLGLITVVIPLVLMVARRTRPFGVYMLVGMLATAIVVGGTGALTLWFLLQ